ncbi:MAG TPA: hypothetical protein VGB65_04325 [Allosphingosinicella sp.]|jgi:hypothetical protein
MMIQIDMFEVGLASALLMQFRTPDGPVRVLADGGIEHGRDVKDTHPRVLAALNVFEGSSRRIDLMIGTHYDADHLDGLVPIIDDKSIEIGEVWLPPIADDSEPGALDDRPGDEQLLPFKFAVPGNEALLNYLEAKARNLQLLAQFRERLNEAAPERLHSFRWDAEDRGEVHEEQLLSGEYFETRLAQACELLGLGQGHADDDVSVPPDLSSFRALADQAGHWRYGDWPMFNKLDMTTASRSLAWIEQREAKDAINAKSLKKVVDALKRRTPAVDMCCRTVDDGTPRRFAWNAVQRRFVPGAEQRSDGPELLLLGPSKGLVAKHWHRLPVGDYGSLLAFNRIPVKRITPSNALSYVLRLSHEGQNILVAGDAGCVDFKPAPRKKAFYPDLIAALDRLAVVQVAHHAGNNAHFYHALLEGGYDRQTDLSYLLISHGVDDPLRPNEAFANFIEQLRSDQQKVSLLFTSRPRPEKVRDFRDLAAPLAGAPAGVAKADVQLVYGAGGWQVTQHHIAP